MTASEISKTQHHIFIQKNKIIFFPGINLDRIFLFLPEEDEQEGYRPRGG
jgi:hypothetical protein